MGMVSCPKCSRSVPEKRTCLYCGALLHTHPAAVQGMNAEQWIREGVRVAGLNQHERALKCFDNSLIVDPKAAIAWYNKALVLARMQRVDEALAAADRALEIWPTDPDILRFRETLAGPTMPARSQSSTQGAGKLINEGAKLAQAGDLMGALACFDHALVLDSSKAIAWANRGLVLADLGRMQEALASLDQALRLAPGDQQIVSVRKRVAEDPRAFLPPGRPWKTALEMAADDGKEGAYIMMASSSIFTELRRFDGPEQIAAMNYILDVPQVPGWNAGPLADQGVLFHVIVRDKTAYSFRYEALGPETADAQIQDAELEAYGALLVTRTLSRITIASNCPFGACTAARVLTLNRRLFAAGLPEPGRVELLHVP